MRQRRFDSYDLSAGMIILLGTLLRFAMIALGWPASYNDEGTLGLMARHIAYQGAHPLLYYGQDYLGPLEAYFGAFFFRLIGPSTFSLRLSLLILSALFLLCMCLLTSLLHTKSLALLTLIVLALGSPDVIFRQLMATGVTSEYLFFTALLLLLTAWLALTAQQSPGKQVDAGIDEVRGSEMVRKRLPWTRLAVYTAWGAIAGLDIWSHLLCLPFVVCAGLLLVLFCRRELRLPAFSWLVLFLLIGASPLLVYNMTVPVSPYANSLFGGGYREPVYPPMTGMPKVIASISPEPIAPIPQMQVAGTLLVALPAATNGIMLCPVSTNDIWPRTDQTNTYTAFCTAVHGAWGLSFVILGVRAAIAAARRQPWKPQLEMKDSAAPQREKVRQAARLMILTGAGLTLLAFMLYPQASAVTPWNSARYLVGLLIAVPVVLSQVWEKRDRLKLAPVWKACLGKVTRYSLLATVLITCLWGTIDIFVQQVPQAQASSTEQQTLIAGLFQAGDTYVYADYDDCNRISFLSNERIICAALDKGLHHGLDRYFPYREMVAKAPRPVYVLLNGSGQAFLFEQKAAELHIPYKKFEIGGYTVYEPAQHIEP